MQAGVRAARCLRQLDRAAEAMACYDRVIAAAQASLAAGGERKAASILPTYWRGAATLGKATLHSEAGEYQAAVDLCRDLLAELVPVDRLLSETRSTGLFMGQQAALHAARCLTEMGQCPEAIALCDRALAIAEVKRHKTSDRTGRQIQEQAAEALFVKAQALAKADQPNQAREIIQRLKSEYALSRHATRIKILEAQLNDTRLDVAEREWDRVRAASVLLAEASRQADGGFWESALALFDHVTRQYADTSAAVRALDGKGQALQGLTRFAEANQVYVALEQQLGEASRGSQLAREVRAHHKWVLFRWIEYSGQKRRPIPDDVWPQFEALCQQILAEDPPLSERLQTQVIMVEGLCHLRRLDEAVQRGEEFLAQPLSDEDRQTCMPQLTWIHLYVSNACRNLRKRDRELEHLHWLVAAVQAQPDAPVWEIIKPGALYHRIWDALRLSGAPAADVEQAAQAVISGYPGSIFAGDIARRQYSSGGPNTVR